MAVLFVQYTKNAPFLSKNEKRLKQEIARKRCLRRKLIQFFFCGEQGVKLIRIRGTGKFEINRLIR